MEWAVPSGERPPPGTIVQAQAWKSGTGVASLAPGVPHSLAAA